MRSAPIYEQVQDLVAQLDVELRRPVVNFQKVREITYSLGGTVERHAAVLRAIHDIAEMGRLSVRTRRWLGVLSDDTEAA